MLLSIITQKRDVVKSFGYQLVFFLGHFEYSAYLMSYLQFFPVIVVLFFLFFVLFVMVYNIYPYSLML
jgi:hypothetical protein